MKVHRGIAHCILGLLLLAPTCCFAVAGGKPVAGSSSWHAALINLELVAAPECVASGGSENFCKQFCSASLIAPQWVVTAAHCVGSSLGNLSAVRVMLGDSDLNTAAPDLYGVTQKFVKSGYGIAATYADDIALLHLDRAANYPVASLSSPTFDTALLAAAPVINDEVNLAGWGRLSASGAFPPLLQQAAFDLVALTDCTSTYNSALSINFISSIMLCAHEPEAALVEADDFGDLSPTDPFGEDACLLDSGSGLEGALGDDSFLIGVVSFGGRGACGDPNFPSVYTRVSAFTGWIESQAAVLSDVMGDLALDVAMPSSGDPGTPLTVTVTMTNRSNATAFAAVDFNLLVSGNAVLSVTSAVGLNCVPMVDGVACHRTATLTPSAATQVVLSLTPGTSGEQTTTVTGDLLTVGYYDYRVANDNFSRTVVWTTKPDIRLSDATAVPQVVDGAGVADLFLTISNQSATVAATGVKLALTLPAGHVLTDAAGLSCSGVPLMCSIGTLAAGESRNLHLVAGSAHAQDGVIDLKLSAANADYPTGDSSASLAVDYNVIAPPVSSGGGGGGGSSNILCLLWLMLLALRTARFHVAGFCRIT